MLSLLYLSLLFRFPAHYLQTPPTHTHQLSLKAQFPLLFIHVVCKRHSLPESAQNSECPPLLFHGMGLNGMRWWCPQGIWSISWILAPLWRMRDKLPMHLSSCAWWWVERCPATAAHGAEADTDSNQTPEPSHPLEAIERLQDELRRGGVSSSVLIFYNSLKKWVNICLMSISNATT